MGQVTVIPHGGVKWMMEGCRCDECVRGRERWKKYRDRCRRRYPDVAHMVDAVDVASRHITALSERGVGFKRLGPAMSVHPDTIRNLRLRKPATVNVDLLAQIEATAKELTRGDASESALYYTPAEAEAQVRRLEDAGMSRIQIAIRILGRSPTTTGIRHAKRVHRNTYQALKRAADQAERVGLDGIGCAQCGLTLGEHPLASRCPIIQ